MDSIIATLTEQERQTVFQCLEAAGKDEFVPEWEFETLFGITRKQLSIVRKKWPEIDTSNLDVSAALIGSMNNFLGYPHRQDEHWNGHLSVRPEAVKLTLEKLISLGL